MVRKGKGRWRTPEEQAEWLFRRHTNANRTAEPGPHALVLVLDHPKSDFNVGKIFRSAHVFGLREVHLVGLERFDPAPAKGAYKHVPARFHAELAGCLAELRAAGYGLVALDPAEGSPLPEIDLPDRTAFLVGHEDHGFSFRPEEEPEILRARIPQYGTTQSLNVSVAASIAMYEWVRRRVVDGSLGVPSAPELGGRRTFPRKRRS